MLAGPMVGGKQTMIYQAVEKPLAKLSEHDRKSYGQLYTSMIDYAIDPKGDKDMSAFIKKTYINWKKDLPDSTIKNLIKGTDEEAIKSMVNGFSDLKRAWWHFFLTYDIASDLRKVQVPVFALNGSKDEQVDPRENLSLIKHIMAQNKNPRYQVYEVRGLNHLFQHCKECGSVKEYLDLDETFDQNTLTVIGTWIKLMLKKPELLQ
jgi:esterase/lipase